MLQLIYISTARPAADTTQVRDILMVSRINNARDGITGLLFFDGKRFLQALEGPPERVGRAYARIGADQRHYAMVELSRREIEAREFGDWAMAARTGGPGDDAMLARIDTLVAKAVPSVQATFNSFAQLRRAA